MKRILIIHTGGTFGMTPMAPENTLKPGKIEQDIARHVPSIQSLAQIDIEIPFNLDSSNIGPVHWHAIYELLQQHYENYDGFTIIHGTDTLVYSAAAISFLCKDFVKPVIFTGAQRPLSAIRSDARSNLINAVELATHNIPEVAICFDNKLYRASRTKKQSIESFHGFDSPNYPPIARIGLNIQLFPHLFYKETFPLKLEPVFKKEQLIISLYPGLDYKYYLPILEQDIGAVIMQGFGSGNIPDLESSWIDFVSAAADQNKPVFITSHSPHGRVDLSLYECGRKALQAGAISLQDMTLEAATVKLMLLTGNLKEFTQIKKYMQCSLAGEMGTE